MSVSRELGRKKEGRVNQNQLEGKLLSRSKGKCGEGNYKQKEEEGQKSGKK